MMIRATHTWVEAVVWTGASLRLLSTSQSALYTQVSRDNDRSPDRGAPRCGLCG